MNTTKPYSSLRFILLLAAGFVSFSNPVFADEEFYGTVESRPTENSGIWVVSGQQVEVTAKTKIDNDHGPAVVGSCVEVEHKKGVVEEIETVKPSQCGRK
jgi:hypothetical protein